MVMLPDELSERVDQLIAELDAIVADPEILRKSEEFHRSVSYLSPEDFSRRFTI